MTSPLTKAVLKSGLIPPDRLKEFQRWGVPIEIPEEPVEPKSLEEASAAIEEALQDEGYVVTRETDLNILQRYFTTQTGGTLHIEIYSTDSTADSSADIEVSYGKTVNSLEYIIPWKSESIAAEITNGFCYLTGPRLKGRVYFESVKELFFGEHKAFMVCTARLDQADSDQEAALQLGEKNDVHQSS